MQILVVNANTSPSVTDIVAAEARRAAAADTEIRAVTGTFGARVITTRTENAIAQHAMVDLMARHHAGCDAAVIAVSFDTGLGAAREMLPVPVVGMTEAALLTACLVGGRFGLVTFGRGSVPLYREVVEGHGLAGRLAAIEPIEAAALDAYGDPEGVQAALGAAALRLVDGHGAEAVILAGAAMAGMARHVQPDVPVPVLDGVDCAVRLAELLARLGLPKPRTGSFAAPPAKELVGVDPAIGALFGAGGRS